MKYRVIYGKSVHNNKEIKAVVKTLKKSTQWEKMLPILKKNCKTLIKNIASW